MNGAMNGAAHALYQMQFVYAAYAVAVPVLVWLVIASVVAMRRAERALEDMSRGQVMPDDVAGAADAMEANAE